MDDLLIDTKQLAALTSTSAVTWARRRCEGNGPKYLVLGRSVRYRLSDVLKWLETQERTSTSDDGTTKHIVFKLG